MNPPYRQHVIVSAGDHQVIGLTFQLVPLAARRLIPRLAQDFISKAVIRGEVRRTAGLSYAYVRRLADRHGHTLNMRDIRRSPNPWATSGRIARLIVEPCPSG